MTTQGIFIEKLKLSLPYDSDDKELIIEHVKATLIEIDALVIDRKHVLRIFDRVGAGGD